jgi:hypothetical protein
MALIDNILAYWNLNNDGSGAVSLVDSTGNGNTLTKNGDVALGAGIINGGAQWPTPFSISPWLENNTVAVNGDFSLSFWVLPSSFSDQPFYAPVTIGNSPIRVACFITDIGVLGAFTNVQITTGASVTFDEWNNIVIVGDGATNSITFYLNGTSVGGGSTAAALNFANVYLGLADDQTGGSGSFVLEGNLDEIGIWNRALSGVEITQLYNSGNGLSYPFVEGGGGVALDIFRLINLPWFITFGGGVSSKANIARLLNLPWFIKI